MKLFLKRISSLVLAMSFFLPLTQCSQKLGDTSPPAAISASNAYEWPSLFSIAALLLFFWPMAIQLWGVMKGRRPWGRKAHWAEVGLSALSLAGISWLVLPWSLGLGASIRYGAYLAYGSVLAYGAISFVEARKSAPARKEDPRPEAGLHT